MLARGMEGNGQFGRDFTVGEASRNQAQHDCLTCGEFQYGSPSTIERASPSLSRERRSPLNIHEQPHGRPDITPDAGNMPRWMRFGMLCYFPVAHYKTTFLIITGCRIVGAAVCRLFEFGAIVSMHHTPTARFLMMIDITD